MSTKLVRHRKSAHIAQSGRCFYCGFPMWESNIESFAQTHNISLPQAKWFQCTAEHLEARKEGGNDATKNIVAACQWCNQRRHKRKIAPSPNAYRQLIQRRLSKGHWHCMTIRVWYSYFFRSDGATDNIRAPVVLLQALTPAMIILRQKKPTRVGFSVRSLPA